MRAYSLATFVLLAFGCKPKPSPADDAGHSPGASTSAPFASAASGAAQRHAESPPLIKTGCSTDGWCEMMSLKKGGLHAIWGTNTGNIYSLWSGILLHFDGNQWAPLPGFDKKEMWGLTGSADGQVWVAGDHGTGFHFDGTWKELALPVRETVRAAFAREATDVWLGGDDGAILHGNGREFKQTPTPAGYRGHKILGLWAADANDAWAVGEAGVLHWDGATWTISDTGAAHPIFTVAGSGAHDVWGAGAGGTIVHWDGARWTAVASHTSEPIFGLWAEDPSNAWAVGGNGTIRHWEGSSWAPSPSGTEDDLHGIWARIGRDVWVVGFSTHTGKTSTFRRKA